MNQYTIIAGVNGTGKSSLRGVLEGQGVNLGHIVDANLIAKKNQMDTIKAGRMAIAEIESCLSRSASFTQETTLSGKRIEKTLQQARKQGYYVVLYYIGLSSAQLTSKKKEKVIYGVMTTVLDNMLKENNIHIPYFEAPVKESLDSELVKKFFNDLDNLLNIPEDCRFKINLDLYKNKKE